MLYTSNKKKVCQVQQERKKYAQHLNRLVQLREGLSAEQLKRTLQQKKLVQTINRVRKMHQCNRQYRWKCMRELQQNSKDIDFSKVKSVLKQGIQKPTLPVASRRKKDDTPIHQQNAKMFQRLCSVKPCLNFTTTVSPAKTKEETIFVQNDFSQLYRNSRLSHKFKKILKIKLGNSKNNVKGVIQLDFIFLLNCIKDDESLYVLEFVSGKFKERTQFFQLGIAQAAQIHIKVPAKNYQMHKVSGRLIKMLSGINQKQTVKSSFSVQEIQKDNQSIQKKLRWRIDFKDLKMPKFKQMSQIECKSVQKVSQKTMTSPRTIMIR